jgi:hypothetical protein
MPIPKDEHAKYLQDVQAFITDVGAKLESIELYKSARTKFIYEGSRQPGQSGAKKEARGYVHTVDTAVDFDGREGEIIGDYEKGFVWRTGAHVKVGIGSDVEEDEGLDIELIKEIPTDLKINVELEQRQYTLDDVYVFASVLDEEYQLALQGRELEVECIVPSNRMDEDEVDFFEKTLIPAAERHGIMITKNFVEKVAYYKKNMESLKQDWAVADFLKMIGARREHVEGSTGVLVHARTPMFELAMDGKDIVWFDVSEDVNDIEYDVITRRIDDAAKELGFNFDSFNFEEGSAPSAAEGMPPKPEQPPRPMPLMPPSEIAKIVESLPPPPPRMALVDMSEVEAMIPPLPPPTPLPPLKYPPKHVESQPEPPELLPSWVLEVSPEQLNAAQGSPAPEQTNHKVKKVMKKVKKKQTDLPGKEDEWPGDR